MGAGGVGKAGHAHGAGPSHAGEQVQAVPGTISMSLANRAPLLDCVPKLPLRDRTAVRMARSATLLVGSTPGISREVRGADQRWSMPSHPRDSRTGALGQELAGSGPHPACPALSRAQGRPARNEGGSVGEEGTREAPGQHPGAGDVATTGDKTPGVAGEVCPAHQQRQCAVLTGQAAKMKQLRC